jgi:hypothetical protein
MTLRRPGRPLAVDERDVDGMRVLEADLVELRVRPLSGPAERATLHARRL